MMKIITGSLMIIGGVCLLAIAFLPTVIAFARDHEYKWPILLINLLLGWTIIGYVGALVWSAMPKGRLS